MTQPTPRRNSSKTTIKRLITYGFLLSSIGFSTSAISNESASSTNVINMSYSDTADLVSSASIVAKTQIQRIRKVDIPVPGAQSAAQKYLLIEARIDTLIRGDGGVAPVVTFLAPAPLPQESKNSMWRKKQLVLLFAQPGSKAGEIRLISGNAAQPWSQPLEAVARDITTELVKNDSPPAITGVGDAFHTAGTIAGEGETQIFLKTATGQPVSISVIRRPGAAPHWGVSLGEIVDESALPPAPDTLLWYRLACSLPKQLPSEAVRSLPLMDAEAAHRDYRLVIGSLGDCGRTL